MIAPTNTTATIPGLPTPNSSVGTTTALSSDFETFLKMLTAQARFQDPMEPLDSSQYAAQLAQFSMVEQQVLSNDLLTALSTQLGAGNMTQLAGFIGMEARSIAATPFDGNPIPINLNPAAEADKAILVVRDAEGVEVQRVAIPVAAGPVEWAGATDDGVPFPDGLYSFEVESSAKGEVLLTDPVATYTRITEARMQDGEAILILEGGSAISASEITGLREPTA